MSPKRPEDHRHSPRSPLWKVPVRDEVREEIEHHFEARWRQYVAEGLSEGEARARARARLGDLGEIENDCLRIAERRDRQRNFEIWASEFRLDVLYALRQFRRYPGWSATLIGILTLGLAATIAVFSLTNAVLLRALPFAAPGELETLWEEQVHRGAFKNVTSPANFLLWQRNTTTLEAVAGFITVDTNLTDGGASDAPAARARMRLATADYFRVLDRPPLMGRTLIEEDGLPGAASVVVLGEALWAERYGRDPRIVGKEIELNGEPSEVVGVMPADFALDMGPGNGNFGRRGDLYAALPVTAEWEAAGGRWLMVIGRRVPGATHADVALETKILTERMLEAYPEANARWTVAAYPLAEHVRSASRLPLLALLVAVLLVLAIVCVNVASLLTVRASARTREVAIRGALGAGKGRIARQVLNEGLVTSTVALGLGLLLAWPLERLLRLLLPEHMLSLETSWDLRVVGFVAVLLVVCSLLFGLVPALVALRRDSASLLRRAISPGRRRSALRGALVFVQIALAVVLLVGAVLMVRSLAEQVRVDQGFNAEGVLSFKVSLPRRIERSSAETFFLRLEAGLASLPGVTAVGAASHVPMTSVGAATSYYPGDRPPPEDGQAPPANIRVLRGDYLQAAGIPLVEGRAFRPSDTREAPPVVLVNRTLASAEWPGQSALGKSVHVHWGDGGERTIVGVVGDVLHVNSRTPPRAAIYFPQEQEWATALSVLVRSDGSPEGLAGRVQSLVAGIDPEVPVFDVASMQSVVRRSMREDRALVQILAVLALAALGLALLGVYGVAAFVVAQRRQEFGVRLALGASPGDIARDVLTRALVLSVGAVFVGAAVAYLLSPRLDSLLFAVPARDPWSFFLVMAALATTAVLAAVGPARRAARVAPALTLRE